MPEFTVVICTRNRSAQIAGALAALDRQNGRERFGILVVDQSDAPDPRLARRAEAPPPMEVFRDAGRGLSRARNLALELVETEWLVFVDDDCLVEEGWAEALRDELTAHADVDLLSGHVGVANAPPGDHLAAAARPVLRPALHAGRWTRPQQIGFGVCLAVRRSAAQHIGGWDERFGAGAADFPAADDMDFNYRLMRTGGRAYVTPRVRATHDQWRTSEETVQLYGGYAASWAAFAMKHLRSGDRVGGLWLWSIGARSVARMMLSGLRHRSRLRLRVAARQAPRYITGTVQGVRRSW